MADWENITCFWASPTMFHMYHERTHTTRDVGIPGADQPDIYDGAELEDVTASILEQFAVAVKDKSSWRPMPLDTQYELHPHLEDIEGSKRRFNEVGHGRYW